jgi:hypothetical protein
MAALALPLLALSSCTVVDKAILPAPGSGKGIFITQQDLNEPYTSLGPIQATRKGVVLFGFADPAGTDLQSGFDELIPEVTRMGGDGVINVRYKQTQYLPATRVLFAILFFIPLPSEVTVTGEVVKLNRPGG